MRLTNRRRRRWLVLSAAITLFTALTGVVSSPANAIVGGVGVGWSLYPYVVKVSGISDCTASLVGREWVLTAAHCIHAGESSVTTYLSNGRTAPSTEIIVHPLWNGQVRDGHDLALLRIPSVGSQGIAPVQVGQPFESGPYMPGPATIVGFGVTSGGPNPPYNGGLRAADTQLLDDPTMADIYYPWYVFGSWIYDLRIGAGSTSQTACKGDSGGPLLVYRHTRPIQVGVFSSSVSGCNVPGAYS